MNHRMNLVTLVAILGPTVLVLAGFWWYANQRPAPLTTAAPAASHSIDLAGPPAVSPALFASPAPIRTAAPAPTALAASADLPTAPDFAGGGPWLNSAPLSLTDLKGKVVLVDFWTFGCYNCVNTLPAMQDWWAKYRDRGLVIVGVHTPEFDHERVTENVAAALKQRDITWPVVQDNDYAIWNAYHNRYWPHFFLLNHRGQVIYDRIGEGAYAEMDRQIDAALIAAGR